MTALPQATEKGWTMDPFTLHDFIHESNSIEGIEREPTEEEIAAHEAVLALDKLTIPDIVTFVAVVAPGKLLRNRVGMNVRVRMNARVGSHLPPSGGRNIEIELMSLLAKISKRKPYPTPWKAHCIYEMLHPFMDGNGRSGRMLWLWQMGGIENAPLGFLHHFYYQTLANSK